MVRRAVPVVLCVLAVAMGAPLYVALDERELLPVPLRDNPWPLEALCGALPLQRLAPQLVAPAIARTVGRLFLRVAWPVPARSPP